MYIKDMGYRIKMLRISNGFTQQQLAERLNITKSIISAYENGQRYPSYEVLISLSSLFKVSTDYLLGVENEQTINISGLSKEKQAALINLVQAMR